MSAALKVVGAVAVALLVAAATATAQAPQTLRIRGQIEAMDGPMLTIKARDGSVMNVKLADNRAHYRDGQSLACRHQAGRVYRRDRHAATGRQSESHRAAHLHGCPARRRPGPLYAVGSRTGQHNDQCRC